MQKTTWTYDNESREYYFHRFYPFQPDLNIHNPAVRTEIRRIMGYWLELGVAGFRVDAVPFIIETPPTRRDQGSELNFEYLLEMRKFAQWRRGDAVFLGEANITPDQITPYFGSKGDHIHMMFNFFVNQHLFYALASADVGPLAAALRATRKLPPGAQWAHFLRNHDELDIDRLDEEHREKVFARFGPEPEMQLYHRGIRRRLAPMLGNQRQMELAYSVMFSLPGTPVLRYGDEIGMGDDLALKERDSVRTPMQWTAEPQAGFSTAAKTIHPVIDEGPYRYDQVNVEAQRRDPNSLLNWTTHMIRIRKECPEIGWGQWKILPSGSPHVLAMRYDWRGNSILVLHNFDEKAHEVRIRPDVDGGDRLLNLIVEDESRADRSGTHRIALEAYGYRWYRVGNVNYALQRSKE